MSKQNGWLSLLLLSLLCPGILSFVTKSPSTAMSSTTAIKGLAQFAPEAASLFHNMNTPASILAGSVVPLGFLGALEIEGPANESKIIKTLRVLYSVVAVMTFASEILVVIWSTVSTNRLIETTIAPAESVWYVGLQIFCAMLPDSLSIQGQTHSCYSQGSSKARF